jgi:hypothetical protein
MDGCMKRLTWLAIGTASLMLAACGTGQSDDTTASVQGNWSGSYTAAGTSSSIPVFAFIQQDGSAYLFDSTGVVYALPSFTGSVKSSGTVTAYPAKGYTFADGSTSMRLAMQADTSSGQMAMQLAPDSSQAQSGQAQLYQLDTSGGAASADPGQWSGYYLSPTPTALAITIAADGGFTGTDAYGCSLQGRLAPLPDQSGFFSLALHSSGSSPACGGVMTGLVHESLYDSFGFFQGTPGTYYYVCASNAGGAFVAELKAQ